MTNQTTNTATQMPTPAAPAKPVARRYKFRANTKCGKRGDSAAHGGFDGVAVRYEGDEFFLTLQPSLITARDKDGKVVLDAAGRPKRVLVEPKMPTWADALEEYPVPAPVKPLRVMPAGSAPTVSHASFAP